MVYIIVFLKVITSKEQGQVARMEKSYLEQYIANLPADGRPQLEDNPENNLPGPSIALEE